MICCYIFFYLIDTGVETIATVKIIQRTDKSNGRGEHPLYLRIYVSKKAYKKLDIYVSEKHFNAEKGRVRKSLGKTQARRINRILDDTEGNAQLALNEVKPLSAQNVKSYLDGVNHDSFYGYTESIKGGYGYHYRGGLDVLLKVMKKYRPSLSFAEITPTFIRNFEGWLLRSRKQNTASSYLRRMRTILYRAMEDGVIKPDENPFASRRIKLKWEDSQPVPLSPEEFRKLRDAKVPDRLQVYKDIFLFSVYTDGMRLTDVLTLKHANIVGGKLNYRMSKTGKVKELELVPAALDIIDRYKGGVYVFPLLSERYKGEDIPKQIYTLTSRIWHRLQTIKKIVGLEDLHFHMARNTTGLLALEAGWSLVEIQEMFKHSSVQQTRDYLGRMRPDKLTQKRKDLFD